MGGFPRWPAAARPALVTLVVGVAIVLAGCGAFAGREPTAQPRVCDGIPEDMGGCKPGQPVYTGDTCDEVAAEWGPAVERLVTPVFGEPPVVDDERRSVRIKDAMVVASLRAAQRLEALGLVGPCSSEAFMAIAEPRFTPGFRARIGDHLYDGDPVATWETFVKELRYVAGVFDAASTESPTPAPSPTPDAA